jgi:hypothetical protein
MEGDLFLEKTIIPIFHSSTIPYSFELLALAFEIGP